MIRNIFILIILNSICISCSNNFFKDKYKQKNSSEVSSSHVSDNLDKLDFEERQRGALTPMYLTDEYFQKRMIELDKYNSKNKKMKDEVKNINSERMTDYENRLARIEKSIVNPHKKDLKPELESSENKTLLVKYGIYFKSNEERSYIKKVMLNEASVFNEVNNVIQVDTELVQLVVKRAGCNITVNPNCANEQFSHYPTGLQYLLSINEEYKNNQYIVKGELIDVNLNIQHTIQDLHIRNVNENSKIIIEQWVQQEVLPVLLASTKNFPKIYRIVSIDDVDNRCILNGGISSGVMPGMVLAAKSMSGKTTKVNMIPIGWESDEIKGFIEIESSIGMHFSKCKEIDEYQFNMNDLITNTY